MLTGMTVEVSIALMKSSHNPKGDNVPPRGCITMDAIPGHHAHARIGGILTGGND